MAAGKSRFESASRPFEACSEALPESSSEGTAFASPISCDEVSSASNPSIPAISSLVCSTSGVGVSRSSSSSSSSTTAGSGSGAPPSSSCSGSGSDEAGGGGTVPAARRSGHSGLERQKRWCVKARIAVCARVRRRLKKACNNASAPVCSTGANRVPEDEALILGLFDSVVILGDDAVLHVCWN